jgi:phosphoheptose isomerase
MSVEEHRLLARAGGTPARLAQGVTRSRRWMGKIGHVSISRLICGGNLISGYAHSRDLIYVSALVKRYHTDERVMDTWALCEQSAINTMVAYPGDPHAIAVYRKYRARGGKIQYIAQISPSATNIAATVSAAADAGAVGAFLAGNTGDQWSREKAVGRIADVVGAIKDAGLIAGVAGHELRTPQLCEAHAVDPDFYVKTLHEQSYWSHQQPGQDRDVIDNYGIDNYWCKEPQQVVRFMAGVSKPWIAYKVLAAGAIAPKEGFTYAFRSGADFVLVGMFDFQVAQDAAIAEQVLADVTGRARGWRT